MYIQANIMKYSKENKHIESCIFRLPESKIFDAKLNISIIDDDRKYIELFNSILSEELNLDFILSKWHRVTDMIEAYRNNSLNSVDLIILDLSMPSINGHMSLQKLKEYDKLKNVPVIVHSSMNDYENKITTYRLEASAYFVKPLNIKLFKSFIYGTIN